MDTGWDLVLALHLLAMAFFVGGQLFLVAAVVPVERRVPDRERLRAIARRFGWGSLVAVAVLIATGAAMASHFGQWDNPKLQVKLGLVGLVGLLIAWHMRRPGWHVIEGAIFVCSLAIVWLGVLIAE
ncbi:MAG: hypothetical protein ACXWDP_00080 [Solirubrobacterales bacterium]